MMCKLRQKLIDIYFKSLIHAFQKVLCFSLSFSYQTYDAYSPRDINEAKSFPKKLMQMKERTINAH